MRRVVTRRLPGFRFEHESPPLDERLPRMDVACFVGFAASGPVDVPVAVESAAHFESVFGRDAALAWDAARGEQVRAYLGAAVRAFFANGGRRCWVVRVARTRADVEAADAPAKVNYARANYFPVPALAQGLLDGDDSAVRFTPAFARARSEGSWSDALETSTALLSRPVQVTELALDERRIEIAQDAPDDLSAGDLLRLAFDGGLVAFLHVSGVVGASADTSAARRRATASLRRPVWFRTAELASALSSLSSPPGPLVFTSPPDEADPTAAVKVRLFTSERDAADDSARAVAADSFARVLDATLRIEKRGARPAVELVRLDFEVGAEYAPRPGSLLVVDLEPGQLIVAVEEVGMTPSSTEGRESVRAAGQGYLWVSDAPAGVQLDALARAERLSFELRVRKGEEYALTLGDLAFGRGHERFWGRLPTDAEIYRADETAPAGGPTEELWQPVGVLRFPLASTDAERVFHFPVAMPALHENFLGAARLPGSALERDGLADFDASLFLDPDLLTATTNDLMPRADILRYTGSATRPLRGIHAALSVEEVTIICAPDAVQRGWSRAGREAPPAPARSEPFARPEWWTFLDCRKHGARIPRVHRPLRSQFLACTVRVVERPRLRADAAESESGTFTLAWEWGPPAAEFPPVEFVLEESGSPDWVASTVIYAGTDRSFTHYGRTAGDYYYRVRAAVKGANETSDWSAGVVVRVTAGRRWQSKSEAEYDAGALVAVQRALLRMSAARADLLAVLSLPGHYREDAALRHVEALTKTQGEGARSAGGVEPLHGGETTAPSYGALYHPWLVAREGAGGGRALRQTPPDGAACGLLARRALTRGAWIAPANEPLAGVVALEPRIGRDRRLDLQLAQVNVVRQEPRGFLVMNSDTLSRDEELREIGVRRLLILLRRLALRHGSAYVFEPNSRQFRRLVERGFESLMDQMFLRGAFAGATPAASYQVVANDTVNTRQSVDLGRFIVELRVAPSRPMTFLTIRLVQTAESGFVTEVR